MKAFKKFVYYVSLVGPIYSFLKDICVNGYRIYINHQEEIETAKMYAKMRADELTEISVDEFLKLQQEIRSKKNDRTSK